MECLQNVFLRLYFVNFSALNLSDCFKNGLANTEINFFELKILVVLDLKTLYSLLLRSYQSK